MHITDFSFCTYVVAYVKCTVLRQIIHVKIHNEASMHICIYFCCYSLLEILIFLIKTIITYANQNIKVC